MVFKTVAMLLIYTIPIVLLNFGVITSPVVTILLYLISGLGIAGIGMGVMHDANHGAYTKHSWLNRTLSYTLDYLGCSSEMWKLQHNVLHHTYTNIHGHDEDIDAPLFLLRFSPYSKSYKIHRFQHYYVWFFYGIMTLYWITVKDFKKAGDYRKMGLIRTKREYRMRLIKLIPLKAFYFSYALVIPMIVAPFSVYWILLGFILMHVLAGILLSVVFQLAHVVEETENPIPDANGEIENTWAIHQLFTTANFAPKNWLVNYYTGGLNHQIEHHIFPNISHIHYSKIGEIVKQTAMECNLPYYEFKTMRSAVYSHFKHLKEMGQKPY